MKELFIARRFGTASQQMIDEANAIIEEYSRQGFTLTLRQLYYQFVSRDLIANKQSEYKRIGSIVNDARLAGLIDWDAIEDRTRNLRSLPTWDSPAEIVKAVSQQFRVDLWDGQRHRPEVWIEKDALVGVIEPVCNEFRVPYFACRGYSSQSEAYVASKRISARDRIGQGTIIFHLGDHDPSGIDMTRDNEDRLEIFLGGHAGWILKRLALNFDQVKKYNPPANPAKATDARFAKYQAEHGDESWELDALDPTVIAALIRDNLMEIIDRKKWNVAKKREDTMKATLQRASQRWDEVARMVGN
jgi:hypothetical protein